MIAVNILEPRTGLTPMSRRRVAVALGLALAVALRRVGRFERVEARAWRGVPDVEGEKIDIELGDRVDVGAVEGIVRRRGWDGVTITLDGELGAVKLGVGIDIYANEHVPVQAGITSEGVNVLAEPRGHIGDEVIESFYELFDIEREKMKTLVGEFVGEMKRVKVAAETRPLWRLVARVHALHDYSSAPEDTMPLWCRPWVRHLARYLYRLSPPELRRLSGPHGMVKIVRDVAPELLKHLAGHYDVEPYEDALSLIPLSVAHHREAVVKLRGVLTEAMRGAAGNKALRIIEERGYLDWQKYIEALEEELKQRLAL